jgi:hypothetical protein
MRQPAESRMDITADQDSIALIGIEHAMALPAKASPHR